MAFLFSSVAGMMGMVAFKRQGFESAVKIILYGFIGVALRARNNGYSACGKGGLRTHSQSAADKHINAFIPEQSRKGAMAYSVGTAHGRGYYFIIFRFVYFEVFGLSEMLKHVSVFIGYRNFYSFSPLALFSR